MLTREPGWQEAEGEDQEEANVANSEVSERIYGEAEAESLL